MQLDSEIISLVKEYIIVPVIAAASWGWKVTHERIDAAKDHADKHNENMRHYVDKEVATVVTEVTRQRDISEKIFDKMEQSEQRATSRHLELLKTFHDGLASKADK